MGAAIPTVERCAQFWEEYSTPRHIREHMKQVAAVARYLGEGLREAGEHVNVDRVERAALLHDTLRVTEWAELNFDGFPYTPSAQEVAAWEDQRRIYPPAVPHAQVNHDLFVESYPEIAQLILLHSIIDAPRVTTWEEKLLNYADRRVAHSTIVTVQERLDEAYARYSKTSQEALERDPQIVAAIYRIEQDIFDRVGGDPDNLPI